MIWRFWLIVVNINVGFRLRDYLLDTFPYWSFHIGYLYDGVKEASDAALAETADVEKFLEIHLKDDEAASEV